MRPFIVLLLWTTLLAPQGLAAQEAEPGVQGRVVDAQTGEPLAGAHVFLAGSTRGTTTNAEGRYLLDPLPPGRYEIAASMLGFEPLSQHLTLAAGGRATLDFRLAPTVIALDEVVVASTRPEHRQEDLDRFEQLFLGLTENAEQCTLVNPEALDFTYDEEADRLRATTREPLIIENRAFGYRVYYHLREFESLQGEVRYLGTSRFEELEPRNRRERRRWERHRRTAYEGSLQHFLATVFDDGSVETARKAGFEVSLAPRFDTDPAATIPVRSGAFLQPAPEPDNRLLAFEDHLLIVYKPDRPAPSPAGVPGAAPPPPRIDEYASWITLNNGPAEVDRFGYLYDPYALTTFGRWSRERLADLLPRDYQPGR
jgi:hypothetical protein